MPQSRKFGRFVKVIAKGTVGNIPLLGPYLTSAADEVEDAQVDRKIDELKADQIIVYDSLDSLESAILGLEDGFIERFEALEANYRLVQQAIIDTTEVIRRKTQQDAELEQKVNMVYESVKDYSQFVELAVRNKGISSNIGEPIIDAMLGKINQRLEELAASDTEIFTRMTLLEDSLRIMEHQIRDYQNREKTVRETVEYEGVEELKERGEALKAEADLALRASGPIKKLKDLEDIIEKYRLVVNGKKTGIAGNEQILPALHPNIEGAGDIKLIIEKYDNYVMKVAVGGSKTPIDARIDACYGLINVGITNFIPVYVELGRAHWENSKSATDADESYKQAGTSDSHYRKALNLAGQTENGDIIYSVALKAARSGQDISGFAGTENIHIDALYELACCEFESKFDSLAKGKLLLASALLEKHGQLDSPFGNYSTDQGKVTEKLRKIQMSMPYDINNSSTTSPLESDIQSSRKLSEDKGEKIKEEADRLLYQSGPITSFRNLRDIIEMYEQALKFDPTHSGVDQIRELAVAFEDYQKLH